LAQERASRSVSVVKALINLAVAMTAAPKSHESTRLACNGEEEASTQAPSTYGFLRDNGDGKSSASPCQLSEQVSFLGQLRVLLNAEVAKQEQRLQLLLQTCLKENTGYKPCVQAVHQPVEVSNLDEQALYPDLKTDLLENHRPASWISKLHKLCERAIADFSASDATSPEGIAQEVLNGASTAVYLFYGLSLLRNMPLSAGCPQCGWAIFWACVAHFPFSVSYHIACALISHGWNINDTPWRCMDQSGVHIVLTVIVLALTQCSIFAMLLVVPFNMYCIILLWCRAKTEARHYRFMRMGVALGIKLACFAYHAEFSALMGLGICWLLGAILFGADRLFLRGWGHMMMHLLLVPISHFLLFTAIQS